MKPNRYIKAMEIGLANEKEGVSYFDLVTELEKAQGDVFNSTAERTFVSWFLENFETSGGAINLHDREFSVGFPAYYSEKISKKEFKMTPDQKKCSNFIKNRLGRKYFLKGLAAKQYLDYQELVESRQTAQGAREASKEANKKAAKSILLAICAIAVSALVALASISIDLMAPKPPFEVRVIEDNMRMKRLEVEKNELKERLYKAEMMLEVYESDSTRSTNQITR